MFLRGINGNLEDECRSAMLHDNMKLSRLMGHVQQVEDSRKKRGVCDVRRPRPQDQVGPSHGGHRNNFGVREQHRFKKGQQSFGNSNSKRSTAPRGGRPEPKRGNGGGCSILRKFVLSVDELTVESADRAPMPPSVVERVDGHNRVSTEQRSGWR